MTKQDQVIVRKALKLIMRVRRIGMPGCQFNQDSAPVVKQLKNLARRKLK